MRTVTALASLVNDKFWGVLQNKKSGRSSKAMKILLLVAAFSLALAVAKAGLIDGAIFVVLGGSAIAAGLLELGAFTHEAALSYGHVLPSDIHNELHELIEDDTFPKQCLTVRRAIKLWPRN
ncbi:hypothetical protein ISCGN_004232 [Ixodes scapularis]